MSSAVDDFMSQLTLINYPPGHLGTFFSNFLMLDDPLYKKLVSINLFGKEPTNEWRAIEYNYMFFHESTYGKFISTMALDHLSELNSNNFKTLLFNIKNIVNKKILDFVANNRTIHPVNLWESLSKEDFQNITNAETNMFLPYLRSHVKYDNLEKLLRMDRLYTEINVKQKIHCCFPKLKQWIPNLLLLDKHIVKSSRRSPASVKFYKKFFDDKVTIGDFINETNFFDYQISNFDTVDMYDLVINKNINQARKVIGFEETNTKKSAVLQIHNDVIETLSYYELDPNMNIDLDNDFDMFRKSSKKLSEALQYTQTNCPVQFN